MADSDILAGTGDGGAKAAAPVALAGPSADDIRAAVQEAVTPGLAAVANFMEQIAAKANAPAAEATAAPTKGADFFTAPESAARDIAQQEVAKAQAPLLAALQNAALSRVYETEKADLDGKAGAGIFDNKVLPHFRAAVAKMTPEQRADEAHLRGVIATIKGIGSIGEELFDARLDFEAKRAEAEEQQATALTGGARRTAARSDDKVTPEERDFLTKWNADVPEEHQLTDKQYVSMRGALSGGTLNETEYTKAFGRGAAKGAAA